MSCEDTWLARLHWHVQLLHHLCSRESQGTQAHIRPESTGQAFLPPTIFHPRPDDLAMGYANAFPRLLKVLAVFQVSVEAVPWKRTLHGYQCLLRTPTQCHLEVSPRMTEQGSMPL
jgi:hypothetical protein